VAFFIIFVGEKKTSKEEKSKKYLGLQQKKKLDKTTFQKPPHFI
jgi:hypothetical protein